MIILAVLHMHFSENGQIECSQDFSKSDQVHILILLMQNPFTQPGSCKNLRSAVLAARMESPGFDPAGQRLFRRKKQGKYVL